MKLWTGLVNAQHRVLVPSDQDVIMKIWHEGYLPWYYPGANNKSEAKPLRLKPGEERTVPTDCNLALMHPTLDATHHCAFRTVALDVVEGVFTMFKLLVAVVLLPAVAICTASSARSTKSSRQAPCVEEHDAWVGHSLKKMEAIKPGMTRDDLLKVFRTEGGLSTGLHRTFVSRDCAYFKVDVEFQAVGRADRDSDGRVTLEEDSRDIIVKISRPYLQFVIGD